MPLKKKNDKKITLLERRFKKAPGMAGLLPEEKQSILVALKKGDQSVMRELTKALDEEDAGYIYLNKLAKKMAEMETEKLARVIIPRKKMEKLRNEETSERTAEEEDIKGMLKDIDF